MSIEKDAIVRIRVNQKEAKEKLEALEKKSVELKKKITEAVGDEKKIGQLTKELKNVNAQIRTMQTNAVSVEKVMGRLNMASPKELRKTIKAINAELNSGAVARGSNEWKAYVAMLKQAKAELAKVNDEMRESKGLLSTLKDKFNDWGAAAASAMAAFAGLVMSGKAAVQEYADMEQEEANVRKFTGMTADEVTELNEAFKKIDTRTSRADLNKLAQEAGRLGKTSKEDVLGFVVAANQINVALDDLGEGATLTLSKLTGIFGDEKRLGTEKSLLAVGSVINELSQNCSASAPYLADFSKRMAGVGAQAKMTIPQIMSFAAVLDSQGQNLEASATALSQLIMKLYQDPAKFAKAAGLEVKKFTDLLYKDANEAVLTLLDALNKMGGMDKLAVVFDEMGTDGARASAVIAALAGNIDAVRGQQVEANKAFKEATSVTKEYDVQNNTVQASLDKAKKKFTELAISLGEKLVPVMRYAISGTSMMMRSLSAIVDFFIKWKGVIIPLTVAITAYYAQTVLSNAALKLHNGLVAISTGLKKGWMAMQYLAAAATAALTGNVNRANIAMTKFNALTKMNPLGLAIGILSAATAAIILYTRKTKDANRALKEISDAEKEAAKSARQEMAELENLYKKTQDLTASMHSRIEAAKKLQQIQPETFKNLSAEAIVAGEAADAYKLLADNIMKTALASAYRDKLSKNAESLADAEIARDELLERLKKSQIVGDLISDDPIESMKRLSEWATDRKNRHADVNSYNPGGTTSPTQNIINQINRLSDLQRVIEEYNDVASKITDKIASIESTIESASSTETNTYANGHTGPTGETEAQRKEREKREREERKRLKENLDKQKAIRDRDEAANISAYASGMINYLQFIERKNQIDIEYINNRKKVYEDANKTETDEYAALLREEEELKAKSIEHQKKATIKEIEAQHKSNLNGLQMQFFNPNSSFFQNQKAYNQALLDEDLHYLNEKLALYSAGSDEWENIQIQIYDRLAQDQLEKQKETAAAALAYSKEYQALDRESRLSHEENLLKQLHEIGLFSEEEYQKALLEIRKKYQNEASESQKREREKRHKAIEYEYQDAKDILANSNDIFGKTILEMMISWQEVMSDMANNGEGFWNSFGELAQSSLSLVSAMLSQFSAYSNAQRDVELANIENRYDKEIKAAGKNTKKVEQLEAQKEKEIAGTKKKYNAQAMRMEIAQAIAQTAVNAILGYQAGLKFPFPANTFMPPLLAGLATAQGAIQIATIKQQHQAQAAGYYEGGFTGGNNYRREAGVVHEGEFIANHNAVNNPELAPVLRLIDYAQRNNRVASLSSEDLISAITGGVSTRGERATNSTVTTINNTIDVEPLNELNKVLSNGINAWLIFDGEKGFDKQYTRFKKLQNNPNR